jgi:hypothetical protein
VIEEITKRIRTDRGLSATIMAAMTSDPGKTTPTDNPESDDHHATPTSQPIAPDPGLSDGVSSLVKAAWMTIMPHDHRMCAVIGLYGGREDNVFWQRVPAHPDGRVEVSGVKTLETGQTAVLDGNIIHSVTNPTRQLTGAIHVYGGDFFAIERSEWDPDTLVERPFDVARAVRLFEEANAVRTG